MKRGSMQCKIPEDMREELSADPFMKRCCVADNECSGKIEWNHHLKFGGKRMSEPFGIVPMCSSHHSRESAFRDRLDRIMVSRATEEQLAPYCKSTNYILLKRSLVVK
jgi:hypothetical protein